MFLLHGMLASREHWTLNLVALRQVVQPVFLELWGHGDSPAPTDSADYQMSAILAQFERLRESLMVEQVFICGHSFGAGIAMRYAIEHPQHVSGLVFLNSLSALTPPSLFTDNPERKARMDALEKDGAAGFRRLPFHPRNALRLPRFIRDILIKEADRVVPQAVVLLNRITGPQLSVLQDIKRIQCPTLLVNGRFEKRFQAMRDIAANEITDCTVIDLDAGHAVNLEQSAGFDEAITDFVDRLKPRV